MEKTSSLHHNIPTYPLDQRDFPPPPDTVLQHLNDPQHPLGDALVRYRAAIEGLNTLMVDNRGDADRDLELAANEVVTRTEDLIRMCYENHLEYSLGEALVEYEEGLRTLMDHAGAQTIAISDAMKEDTALRTLMDHAGAQTPNLEGAAITVATRTEDVMSRYDPQHPLCDALAQCRTAMDWLHILMAEAKAQARNLTAVASEIVRCTGDLIRQCRDHGPGQHLSQCLAFAVRAQEELNAVRRMPRAPRSDSTYILPSDCLPDALRCVPWLIAARQPETEESKTEKDYFVLLTEACTANGIDDANLDYLLDLGRIFKQSALSLLVELGERREREEKLKNFVNSAAALLKQLASQARLPDHEAFELRHSGSPVAQGMVESLLPPASSPLPPRWWSEQLPEGAPTTSDASPLPRGTDVSSPLRAQGDTHGSLTGLAKKLSARFDYKMREHEMLVDLLPKKGEADDSGLDDDGPDVISSAGSFKQAAYALLRQTVANGINDTSVKDFNAVWASAEHRLIGVSGHIQDFDNVTWNVFSMTEEMPDDIAGLVKAVKEHAPG